MRKRTTIAMLVALPRNRSSGTRAVARLKVGDLEIDALRRQVRQGSREIKLSPDQHILLYILAARAGEVVGYREIADALGQTDLEIRNNTLARHLSALRRKLRDDPAHPRYIETISRVGYRFRTTTET